MTVLDHFKDCFGRRGQHVSLRQDVDGLLGDSARTSMPAMLEHITDADVLSIHDGDILGTPMPVASWLFLRGSESIWVEQPHGHTMVVAGPGAQSETREFADEDALQEFQIALARRLRATGWFLAAFDYERRRAADRRSVPRATTDRRQEITGHH